MMFKNFTLPVGVVCLGISISVGLCLSGIFIGRSLERFHSMDRSVTVRGISEKIVTSDLGEWTIKISSLGKDPLVLKEKVYKQMSAIVKFLEDNNFAENEISDGEFFMNDKFLDFNSNKEKDINFRYNVGKTIVIKTKNIKNLAAVINKLPNALYDQECVLDSRVKYSFTKLNEIKPEMIKESTVSARDCAKQFANDSESKVGGIKHASQGLFSVTKEGGSDNGYDNGGDSEIMKQVRVVSTITFELLQ